MTTSPENTILGQATEKNSHFYDSPVSGKGPNGRSEEGSPIAEIAFTSISSFQLVGETASPMVAIAPEACLATTHPAVLVFGGLLAAAGFGLLAYGFMS